MIQYYYSEINNSTKSDMYYEWVEIEILLNFLQLGRVSVSWERGIPGIIILKSWITKIVSFKKCTHTIRIYRCTINI